jgi:hypothetical protein
LSWQALATFLAVATASNFCLSTLSVLLCIHTVHATPTPSSSGALFRYDRVLHIVLLIAAGVVSNFGYRQYLVAWQLKGLYDFLKGKKSWDKFARKGFETKAAT